MDLFQNSMSQQQRADRSNTMNQHERILITGASGQLGQAVLQTLLQQGQTNLIGTTRSPEKLADFAKKGVEVRTADFAQPEGLVDAFQGATRLLLISGPEVGIRVQQHKNAIDAAKKAGVRHIMYTSLVDAEKSIAAVGPDHVATESYMKQSGLQYTFLRNNTYAENLLLSLPQAIETGMFYGCAGDGKVAYVTRQDCAKSAAGALMNAARYENTALEITGPASYSGAEVASLVSDMTNKKIAYQDLSPEEYKAALIKSGLPEHFAELFVSFDLSTRHGDVAFVSAAVEELTGEAPQDLRSFLKGALK
jgi:NAD(P)H dehydrogenase (quinone)